MRVFIVGPPHAQIEKMFASRGHVIVNNIQDADLVQFTGGSDVDPILYGRLSHKSTSSNLDRDKFEVAQYTEAKALGKKIAGICRGAQFLCVMAGHELWQDVSGHANYDGHLLVDIPSKTPVHVTSTHHQMMRLNQKGSKYFVVATAGHIAKKKIAVEDDGYAYTYSDDADKGEDLEVVHFTDENSLAFQPHPEYKNGPCREYYFECLHRHLNFK